MIGQTVEAWADIVEKQWKAEINKKDIGVTGALYDSIKHEVEGPAESPNVVRFRFNEYGIFVNYGVGREFMRGYGLTSGSSPKRKSKRWYSGIIYRETHVLAKLLADKMSDKAIDIIIMNIRSDSKRFVGGLVTESTAAK